MFIATEQHLKPKAPAERNVPGFSFEHFAPPELKQAFVARVP